MGARKHDNKHGVGIMLNKKCQQKIIDTEYMSERSITTTIVVNHQHIKLMSVYFPHSGYADQHVEKCTKRSKSTRQIAKKYTPNVGGDFNAELGPDFGTESLNEGNKRGDWMKHWMMLQGYTALNTMYRKTPAKQTTDLQKVTRSKLTTS